jgi:dinuclear metal center YbgI/SA1388 family protein
MSINHSSLVCVCDIIEVMEAFAPLSLSETWDNCGLQVGDHKWPVKKIWVALDPLLEVVEAANRAEVDFIVTHHPLMIEPIRNIDLQTVHGKIIAGALQGRTAIYSAHTNLDSTYGGTNDILAKAVGLTRLTALIPAPQEFEMPHHDNQLAVYGMGRVGDLQRPCTVAQLAADLKQRLGLKGLRVIGEPERQVVRAALCSGSGSSLLGAFFESEADVFISADFKYHDARVVQAEGRTVIDMGHFDSEHLFIVPLVDYLNRSMQSAGWDVVVEACTLESDPFVFI